MSARAERLGTVQAAVPGVLKREVEPSTTKKVVDTAVRAAVLPAHALNMFVHGVHGGLVGCDPDLNATGRLVHQKVNLWGRSVTTFAPSLSQEVTKMLHDPVIRRMSLQAQFGLLKPQGEESSNQTQDKVIQEETIAFGPELLRKLRVVPESDNTATEDSPPAEQDAVSQPEQVIKNPSEVDASNIQEQFHSGEDNIAENDVDVAKEQGLVDENSADIGGSFGDFEQQRFKLPIFWRLREMFGLVQKEETARSRAHDLAKILCMVYPELEGEVKNIVGRAEQDGYSWATISQLHEIRKEHKQQQEDRV